MKKLLRWAAALALTAVLLAGGLLVSAGYTMYRDALDAQSLSDKVAEVRSGPSYTPLSELPETYIDAVVAAEDHRFWHHCGIDVIAIGRAAWNNLLSGSFAEGGSTITQQLAKNLYFTQDKVLERKVAEVFLAFRLERAYSKEEILELYVNSIYYGDGYYCVRDASLGYFGKEPQDMTDDECTLLAGIPNAPSAYAPSVNPALARQRQQYVIRQMERCGYLSGQEADSLLAAQA